MNKIKAVFGRAGRFAAAHKKAAAALVLAAAILAALLVWRARAAGRPAIADASGQSYVRTVTLQRGSLEDSISASGTVASDKVSNVTTELKYTVKTVNVQVGDSVKEGDVICTLDTADLEKRIASMKEDLAQAKAKALKSYQTAQDNLTEAEKNVGESYNDKEDKRTARDSARSAYESAEAKVKGYQSAADSANAALLAALSTKQDADAQVAAYEAKEKELQQADPGLDAEGLKNAVEAATGIVKADADQAKAAADTAYAQAQKDAEDAQKNLNTAKSSTGYDGLQAAYSQAQSAYEQAKTAHEQAQKAAETAEAGRDDALEAYNKAGESSDLEELQQELEKCTLKAETGGKVTAVNATVGSAITGAAATIQDTDKLKIAISIAEYDIESVKVGMKAVITSDVIDGQVNGTLTQISPTASGGGTTASTFAAEVTVDDADSGLLVGTNAKVQIVRSVTDNVFTVPLDAIETQEDGATVIYARTGEGADGQPSFEPVAVTVGASNDYYAEISGSQLSEGMVVRAAADEAEATDTADPFQMSGVPGGQAPVAIDGAQAMPEGGRGGGMAAPAMEG